MTGDTMEHAQSPANSQPTTADTQGAATAAGAAAAATSTGSSHSSVPSAVTVAGGGSGGGAPTPTPAGAAQPPESQERFTSCHQCKTGKSNKSLLYCTRVGDVKRPRRCRKKFCEACLARSHGIQSALLTPQEIDVWICPACLGTCGCAACNADLRLQRWHANATQILPATIVKAQSPVPVAAVAVLGFAAAAAVAAGDDSAGSTPVVSSGSISSRSLSTPKGVHVDSPISPYQQLHTRSFPLNTPSSLLAPGGGGGGGGGSAVTSPSATVGVLAAPMMQLALHAPLQPGMHVPRSPLSPSEHQMMQHQLQLQMQYLQQQQQQLDSLVMAHYTQQHQQQQQQQLMAMQQQVQLQLQQQQQQMQSHAAAAETSASTPLPSPAMRRVIPSTLPLQQAAPMQFVPAIAAAAAEHSAHAHQMQLVAYQSAMPLSLRGGSRTAGQSTTVGHTYSQHMSSGYSSSVAASFPVASPVGAGSPFAAGPPVASPVYFSAAVSPLPHQQSWGMGPSTPMQPHHSSHALMFPPPPADLQMHQSEMLQHQIQHQQHLHMMYTQQLHQQQQQQQQQSEMHQLQRHHIQGWMAHQQQQDQGPQSASYPQSPTDPSAAAMSLSLLSRSATSVLIPLPHPAAAAASPQSTLTTMEATTMTSAASTAASTSAPQPVVKQEPQSTMHEWPSSVATGAAQPTSGAAAPSSVPPPTLPVRALTDSSRSSSGGDTEMDN